MDPSISNQLNRIEQKVDALTTSLAQVKALIDPSKRKPTQLRLDADHIQLLNKHTGVVTMSGTINATSDHDVRVPLKWSDDVGAVSAPTAGTTAVSDNAAVVASVDVAADDMSVVCRTAGDGTANVSVANGGMTDSVQIVVGPPVASAVVADAASATMVAKGSPA